MADEGDTALEFPAVKLDLLDVRLQAVLANRNSDTRQNVEEELSGDFELDFLLEEREKAFSVAKGKFENVLRADGMLGQEDKVDIEVSTRTNRSTVKNIVKEIVDIYDYIMGYTEIFPKAVISKASRYIDISEKDVGRGKTQIYNPVMDRMRLTEIANLVRDLQSEIDSLKKNRNEDREMLIKMEQEIVQLQGQVKLQTSHVTHNQNPGTSLENKETALIQKGNQDNPQANGNHTEVSQLAPTITSPAKSLRKLPKPPPQQPPILHNNEDHGKKSSTGRSTVLVGEDGERVTVIHRGGSLAKEIAEQVLAGKQPTGGMNWPNLPNPKKSIGDVHGANINGGHGTDTRRQPKEKAGSKQTRELRGMKQERGSTLYVKNIAVEDETDEEIGQMVKEHCKEHGIRVTYYRVMRYRAASDVVGCRIVVPQSQEHLALSPHIWPANVEVRRWEAPAVWYKKNERERYPDRSYRDMNGGYKGEDEQYYSDNREDYGRDTDNYYGKDKYY